jgi:hypothetical protein
MPSVVNWPRLRTGFQVIALFLPASRSARDGSCLALGSTLGSQPEGAGEAGVRHALFPRALKGLLVAVAQCDK